MRQVYASEAALAADAKAENVKVTTVDSPKFDPVDGHVYYKVGDAVYRNFAVVDGSHIMVNGVLVHVDDQVPMGTAGTLRMPRTGNVLSVPRPDVGETLAGYYLRTSKQTGGAPARVGEFVATVADKSNAPDAPVKKNKDGTVIAKFVPDRNGTPLIDWPLMADWFANAGLYAVAVSGAPAGAGVVTPGAAVHAAASTAGVAAAAPPSAAGTAKEGQQWENTATGEKWKVVGGVWKKQ